jgi:hypothetical protein
VTWFGVALIVLCVVNSMLVTVQVGKPRKPMEPAAAAIGILLNALIVWGVLAVGTNP